MEGLSVPNLKLASAGDVVKIWDSSTFKLCNQLKGKNVSFQSVHWSSDFRQTVSIPDRGEKIILSCWLSPVQHVELSVESCCVAQFSSTSSRFLGVGTKTGSTLIYDIKHKKTIKTFGSATSAVTCLQYNWNDSYIACGYSDGSLMLHNSNTGQSSSPLVVKNAEKIRSLHYSYTKKSLIGCCSEDGGVMLWDANTRQLCGRFSDHQAPATGLQFSPMNNYLLASIGLDKKIHFYDIEAKKLIRTMDSDAPLCALDFKEDGFTLAVGCTRGRIYFYDLRSPLFAHHTIQAHTSSVHSLAFQSTVVSAASKEKSLKRMESSKIDSTEFHDTSKYIKHTQSDISSICLDMDAGKEQSSIGSRKKESLTADIFSPIRESTSFANETIRNARNSTFFENNNFSFATLSPLQEQKVLANSSKFSLCGKTDMKKKNMSSISTKRSPPTLDLSTKSTATNINECFDDTKNKNGSLKQQLFKAALSPQSSLGICSRSGDCSSAAAWSCNPKDIQTSKDDNQNDQIVRQQPKLLENATVLNDCSNQPFLPKTHDNPFPENAGDKGNSDILAFESSDLLIDEGKGTSKSTTPITPQAFQTEFFRQLLVDTMEEHTDAIRRYFHQLHVQMARDFERQSEQLEEIFLSHAASPDHIVEIRKRREDCYLQNIFR